MGPGKGLFRLPEAGSHGVTAKGKKYVVACRRGCRAGGPPCSIKDCAERRGFAGCWECDDFASCSKLEKRLAVPRGAAHLYNLRKLKRDGVDAFLAGPRKWYAK